MIPSELLADTIEAAFLIGKNVINNAKVNGEITELERRRLHLLLSTGKYTENLKLNDGKIVYAYFSGDDGISITAEYYPTVKEFIKELESKCE